MVILGSLVTTSVFSEEPPIMQIDDAWLRAVPPVAHGTAGYFKLTNASDEDWQLVSVNGEAARHWMIHKTIVKNGISKMIDPGPLWIRPGETLLFKPQDLHIMVMGINKPLEIGNDIVVNLVFANRDQKRVQQSASFQVRVFTPTTPDSRKSVFHGKDVLQDLKSILKVCRIG